MALALYRKYRPRTFAEIIGQEHVTEPLSQALRTGRLHHAYLFSGPRGCGKTSSARILARSLNCVKGPTPDPCGECESCVALAPDGPGSIDVIEIDAASHGGVDDARDLRERAFFAPASSRFKVYVIDEAHMVSPAGFNALLKLVEEPPDFVKFVFATTEPEKVLGTIKSRTHHYPFRLIPPGILRPYLEQLCAAEGVTVQPAVYPLVVRSGAGSARDTLSVLDQLIAGAGPEGVTYARAVALLGVTDVALIDEMCDALAAGDGAAAYATIDRVAEAGHDPRRFAGDLLERLRDLIVLQQVPDAATKGLLGGADDELERMTAQAERFGAATLSRMADIVHTGLVDMRGTTGPRLVLELVTARMLLPGADDSTAALLQRMERMERRLTLAGDETDPPIRMTAAPVVARSTAATPAEPTSTPAPVAQVASTPVAQPVAASDDSVPEPTSVERGTRSNPAPGPTAALDAAAVRRIWDEVLTMVRRKSPRAAAVVREATVRDVRGDVLVLLFKHQFHAQALATAPELLLDALYEILGGRWQVQCEVAGQTGAVSPANASPTGPPRSESAAHPEPTPAAVTSPPTSGRRTSRSESGGARQRSSDATASEGASAGHPAAGGQGATGGQGAADGKGAAGGAGSVSNAAGGPSMAVSEEDWPTPATLGGPPPEVEPAGVTPAEHAGGRRSSIAAPAPAADAIPGRQAAPRASIAAARAAAAGGGTSSARSNGSAGAGSAAGTPGTGRVPSGRTRGRSSAPTDDAWSNGNEEPPYDPEFDGPIASATNIGFDPGDEPDDDADAETVRATSEQQALDLLRQQLGAEKIAEIDNR
jgi:DNA polymerase-3 subunit gamma/tau